MRCPDCMKMVSYGEPEIEIEDESVDDFIATIGSLIGGTLWLELLLFLLL